MTLPRKRLRPHPSERLSGPAVPLKVRQLARDLRAERHPPIHGHRQATLIHRGPLRLVLFAFEVGGELPQHRAPGQVVIHCLRGEIEVDAAGAQEKLQQGEALFLDPDVPHSVRSATESDMLLTVCVRPET
jgi:quercetin dioxygenase-like cupin family protein